MEKVFKVSDIRDLEHQLNTEQITYSRMVEIMNEMAYNAYKHLIPIPFELPKEKTCKRCDQSKPVNQKGLDGFYKHPKTSDGYFSECIQCSKEKAIKRYHELK